MSKDKISEYSTTNALNTDIGGIDIDENCLPSNLNDAIREVMVQLKEFQDGSSGDDLTVGGDLNVTGEASLNSTGAVKIPVGTQAERPTPAAGMLRFNDDSNEFEGYNGTAWASVGGSGYTSKTISENTTLNADTEYETGRNLRINHGIKLTVPNTTLLIVRKYAAGSSL
jgi:hypothetical protein